MLLVIQNLNQRIFFIGLSLFFVLSINAQNLLSNYSDEWGDNGFHFNVVNVENLGINKGQSSNFIADYLKLSKQSLLIKKFPQNVDNDVIRYSHTVNNQRILGSEVIAHFNGDILKGFNGIIYNPTLEFPTIDIIEAKQIAIQSSGGKVFNWQIEEEEAMIKLWTEDSLATYNPIPELIYAPQDLDFSKEFSLCYGFEINAVEPLIKKKIYIHAQTGEVWATEDLIHVVEVKGTANTKYRGVRSIQTDSTSPTNFRLRESGRGKGIETYNMQKGTSYGAAVDFLDTDNYWNNYNVNLDEFATDAHHGAEMTYDYFLKNFGRNSFDGNGAKIRSYIHYRSNYVNAFWNGYVMTYGDGNGTSWSPLTSVDICGHEVTHAVTTNSAGLIYRYESGALNESFSDIFGNAIEFYADSTQFDWGMGEDITSSGRGIRNMARPNDFRDPDTYKGTYWHTAPSDNGGVHVNSGVQNYWFYLLTKGVSGINDNGDSFKVDSIGIKKAQQIAFRNLTNYLTPSSNFQEARYYAIQSATDLYGECSNEVIATTNAWYAVGVGPKYDSSSIKVDFSADTLFCFSNDVIQFSNESVNTKSYSWTFGDGKSSTLKNPNHIYGAQGKYNVKLVAEGCFLGVKDSIRKIAYIEIDSLRDICKASLPIAGKWTTYNVCEGFVYDHGGESNYLNLTRDTVTLNFGISDSAYLSFSEFAYEEGFDSVYIYNGPNTSSPLIGGFTGDSIPNRGKPIKITSGAVTLRHFSDQFATLSGYKAEFKAFRPSLSLTLTPDTTVCFNQDIWLTAVGSGGSYEDYSYTWNGVLGTDSLLMNFTSDTTIYLRFGDDCMQQFIYDSVIIKVLNPLVIEPLSDSTLCFLEDIKLNANASGGLSNNYTFKWLPFNLDTNNWATQFRDDEVVSVIVSDGCTPKNDTTTFNVKVRDSLSHTQQSPSLICQGESATLQLNPSGGLSTYDYWFSDGTSSGNSSSVSWTVNPVGAGQHRYWISYTDQCTPTNDTAFYTIALRDSLSIDLTKDTLICEGQSLTLKTLANGGNPLGYQYDWGRGKTSLDSLVVNPSISTSFTVRLSDGCSVFEPNATVTVSLRDPLNVTVLGKDTACYGENITYQAIVTGGDSKNYTYKWNYGAGNSRNYTLPILFSNQKVVVQVDDGCSLSDVRDSIYVAVRPQLNIDLPTDIEICIGDSYDLLPSATGGILSNYQFTWNNGLGNGPSKTVTPVSTTTYVVTLFDNCSQPVIGKSRIIVNPIPVVDFDVSPNPSCEDNAVNFTNLTNTGERSRYKWDFGDGNSSNQENTTHSYSSDGMYSVQLFVTNEYDCMDSLLKMDVLEIVPNPSASFTHTPDIANFYQPDFVFTNTSLDATNYTWDFGDGASSSGFGASHSYADTGFFKVTLTVENNLGCIDVYTKVLQVEDAFKLFTPNAFSPNDDNTNDVFSIQYRGVKEFSIMIFNRWGEVLFKSSDMNDSWDGTFNGDKVQEGIYYYTAFGKDYKNEVFQSKGEIMLLR